MMWVFIGAAKMSKYGKNVVITRHNNPNIYDESMSDSVFLQFIYNKIINEYKDNITSDYVVALESMAFNSRWEKVGHNFNLPDMGSVVLLRIDGEIQRVLFEMSHYRNELGGIDPVWLAGSSKEIFNINEAHEWRLAPIN